MFIIALFFVGDLSNLSNLFHLSSSIEFKIGLEMFDSYHNEDLSFDVIWYFVLSKTWPRHDSRGTKKATPTQAWESWRGVGKFLWPEMYKFLRYVTWLHMTMT